MSIIDIDLNTLADVVSQSCDAICECYRKDPIKHPTLTEPELICRNLRRYVEIIRHFDAQQRSEVEVASATVINEKLEELNELSDDAMQQLQELGQWSELLKINAQEAAVIDELSIPFALWSARHVGKLGVLEPVVTSLSNIANHTNNTGFLKELSGIMNEIANAASPEIKHDEDKSNEGRPWRILNLNHAIVATRTHDPGIMEQVFEQVLIRLPDDAANFFKEGMEQMDEIGYPIHVRNIMEKYFQLTNNPTLH